MRKIIINADQNRDICVLNWTEGGDNDASQEVMDFGNIFENWPFDTAVGYDPVSKKVSDSSFNLLGIPPGLWVMEYNMSEDENEMLDCRIYRPMKDELFDLLNGNCLAQE